MCEAEALKMSNVYLTHKSGFNIVLIRTAVSDYPKNEGLSTGMPIWKVFLKLQEIWLNSK